MDSRGLILAALLSTLFLSLPDSINGVSSRILIANACLRSNTPKLCIATLKQIPATSSATDAISLAQIALQAVSEESTTAVIFIDPLTLCSSLFQNTKGDFLVGDGDFKTGVATTKVEDALAMVGRCEAALKNATITIPGLDVLINRWKTLYDAGHCATLAAEFDI